ncbi:MAG: hypothetical protein J7521_04165 [Caulobacter sp.]|nr:hypothetical protein [Caulobacter sp.]
MTSVRDRIQPQTEQLPIKLVKDGRLKEAVDPLTLAKLRVRLDWRMFVDVDTYALIDHPNNYYCEAAQTRRQYTNRIRSDRVGQGR